MSRRWRMGLVLAALVWPGVATAQPPEEEMVTISGAEHPEQIPNWSAWLEAFRFMAGPSDHGVPIPTSVWRVTTAAERTQLRKAAQHVMAVEAEVSTKAVSDGPHLTPEQYAAMTPEQLAPLQAVMDGYEMKRRRAALAARDRLCQTLSGDAQVALLGFVDEQRRATTVVLPKSQLANYRLPE